MFGCTYHRYYIRAIQMLAHLSISILSVSGYTPYTTLQWQQSIDSINWSSISSADTTDHITTQISVQTYFRVKVRCGTDSSYTSSWTVPLRAANLCYCTAGLGNGCATARIDTVRILNSSLNLTNTYCNPSSGYTAWPASGNMTTTLKRGATYQLYAHFTEPAIASLWIDYDQSHHYDASEWSQISNSAINGIVTFTVPLTATLGLTGLRVRSRNMGSANGSGDACTSFSSGQTYDFFVNISDSLLDCSHHPVVTDQNIRASCTSNTASINELINVSTIFPQNTGTYYSHHWSTGDTSVNLSNVATGIYTDTITFNGGCVYVASPDTILAAVPLSYHLDSTRNAKCNNDNSGGIFISISGGSGSYAHHWSNGATSSTLPAIPAGIYADSIIDVLNGCRLTYGPDTITQPSAIVVTRDSVRNVACGGATQGGIYVSVAGGTASYTYHWSISGTYTSQDLITNVAGAYSLTVTDQNACTRIYNDTVKQSGTNIPILHTDSIHNVKCNGQNNGAVYISASGGQSPLHFVWSNTSASQNLTNAMAGAYAVTVTDGNNCTATMVDTVKQPALLTLSATASNQVGLSGHGSITLTPSGGTAVYHYRWNTGDSINPFTGLLAGLYTATVTDANGCTATITDSVRFIPTGISEINNIKLFQIYPNPNTGQFNISVSLARSMMMDIEVYTITGQSVYLMADEYGSMLDHHIDLGSEAEGIYIVKLKVGDHILIKRVSIIKQ